MSYFAKLVEGYEGYQTKPHILPDYDGSKHIEGNPQATEYLAIPQHIVESVRAVAKQCQVNVATVYEGVYAFMGYTECGSSDLMYRRVSTGRGFGFEKIGNIAGTFVATPPTRMKFNKDNTFAELFQLIEKQFNRDMRYEYADFAKMLDRIGEDILVYSPYFSYQQTQYEFTLTDEVSLYYYDVDSIESIDLFLFIVLSMTESNLTHIRMQYNKSRFSLATIKRFLNTYLSVLAYVVTHTKEKLSEVPVQVKGVSAIQQEKKQPCP
ncbi:hypothetical protein Holit_02938 [Hollandina sp. SP2]